jgi:hypothetical protein
VQPRLLQRSEISVRSYRCRLQADLQQAAKITKLKYSSRRMLGLSSEKVFGNRFHSLLSLLFFGTVFFTDALGFLVGDFSDRATLFLARGLASATAAICGLST